MQLCIVKWDDVLQCYPVNTSRIWGNTNKLFFHNHTPVHLAYSSGVFYYRELTGEQNLAR